MSYLERIRAARRDYLDRLRAENAKAKAAYAGHWTECMYELPDPESFARRYFIVDMVVAEGDEPRFFDVTSDPVDLRGTYPRAGGQQLHFKGFAWSGLALRALDGPPPVERLRPWFEKWMGDGSESANAEGFAGVIHSLAFRDGNRIVVDLGTAPVDAFEELLGLLAAAGIRQVEIESGFKRGQAEEKGPVATDGEATVRVQVRTGDSGVAAESAPPEVPLRAVAGRPQEVLAEKVAAARDTHLKEFKAGYAQRVDRLDRIVSELPFVVHPDWRDDLQLWEGRFVFDFVGIIDGQVKASSVDTRGVEVGLAVTCPNGAQVRMLDLAWERVAFEVTGAELPSRDLAAWFEKWSGGPTAFDDAAGSIDEARASLARSPGRNGANGREPGLRGIVHALCLLHEDNEVFVDFGSAPVAAFFELLDILVHGGARQIEIYAQFRALSPYKKVIDVLGAQQKAALAAAQGGNQAGRAASA